MKTIRLEEIEELVLGAVDRGVNAGLQKCKERIDEADMDFVQEMVSSYVQAELYSLVEIDFDDDTTKREFVLEGELE